VKILKRKDKLHKTITVRVPDAFKAELDQLRERAVAAGFDLGAMLRKSLASTVRQFRSEMDALETKRSPRSVDLLADGIDHSLTAEARHKPA
jgi:hypothetical protein